ncbi:MAG: RimK family alpha-L-glutamate ligase [Armatimonadota bacterium]
MYRIAVITSDRERDLASRDLVAAASKFAGGDIVDPLDFRMEVNGSSLLYAGDLPVDAYDAFIVRGFNRLGEIDYQYEVLELLEYQSRLVVNSTEGLSVAESKAQTTALLQKSGFPVPRTLITQNLDEAISARRRFGTVVIKPLYGSHGKDMARIEDETVLPDFLAGHGAVYIQEYVENEGRDIRAFVVGDRVVASVYRVAKDGEWRTNVAQGSNCEPCELSEEMHDLCVEATRTIGLEYTGVDLMESPDGPLILELNGAPWWQGLYEATGRNVAEDVVLHVLSLLSAGRPARRPRGL